MWQADTFISGSSVVDNECNQFQSFDRASGGGRERERGGRLLPTPNGKSSSRADLQVGSLGSKNEKNKVKVEKGMCERTAGVAGGAIAGHILATLIAVIGGAFVSQYISEKTIGYIGGSLFMVFAALTLLGIF